MDLDFARFVFGDTRLTGRTIELDYRLEGAQTVRFTERIELPPTLPAPPPTLAVEQAIREIHHILGISYFKAACPPVIAFDGPEPDPAEAAFLDEVWTQGLGEFSFVNQLLPKIAFPSGGAPPPPSPVVVDPERVLLMVGGGKDSVVSREILRDLELEVDCFSVGAPVWIRRSVEAAGDPHQIVRRSLDPALFRLNDAGALNGHIPISACIAAIARLVAMVGGYSAVISSNEHSASFGNLVWEGLEVNHQWSKGVRFEALFDQRSAQLFPGGPRYLSLLRPLTELAIGRLFARAPRYFDAVTSCNANFRLRAGAPPARWCGHCPKCVFVAVVLQPWLSDAEIQQIFGRDLLADPARLPMLRALAGLADHKPFECVGTPEEVRAGLYLRAQRVGRDDPAATLYRERLDDGRGPEHVAQELELRAGDRLPTAWREALDAAVRAD